MSARLVLVATLALACHGARPEKELPPEFPRGPEIALPPDWKTSSPSAFEAWVRAALPEERATPLDKNSLRELEAALDQVTLPRGEGVEPLAVRAAVILGRSRHPTSARVLIRRLERRVVGPQRYSDCGDAVAAAALARFPDPKRHAQRLVPLAVGSNPHPDLEVRVECAATALHVGYEQVIPFLLQVLRIDTYQGQKDQRDFPISPTTAWARGRAAEALSLYAGVPVTYHFDGSIAAREEEAEKLAQLLVPPAPAATPPTAR